MNLTVIITVLNLIVKHLCCLLVLDLRPGSVVALSQDSEESGSASLLFCHAFYYETRLVKVSRFAVRSGKSPTFGRRESFFWRMSGRLPFGIMFSVVREP